MPDIFTPLAMTYPRFVEMLRHYLARFQETTHLLAEARLLARPATEPTAALHRDLQAYSWAVQSRALLRTAEASTQQQALELHLRLSVVETLVAFRCGGQLAALVADCVPDETAPTPHQLQRLAAAEARVFHLYQIAPLN